MTSRVLAYIIRDQKPLVLPTDGTVQEACRRMWERRSGSVLLANDRRQLVGIFTGRDAVRLLAKGDGGGIRLAAAMTRKPVTIAPKSRAVDALRAMAEGGFRHLPVTEDGVIKGIVSRGDIKGMEFEAFRRQQSDPWSGPEAHYRRLAEIIKGRKPLVAGEEETVRRACQSMRRRRCGSVLVIDGQQQRLTGIFTGRDAVRLLATSEGPAVVPLKQAMTMNPLTLGPQESAIDALRAMSDGGFRHVPVVEGGKLLGVVSRNDFTGIEIDRLDEEEHLQEVIW